ncbi:MAG: 3-deoxy-manno-octulosonate cytidylyltransferase [Sedimentisphaerales bacterium]|nr:3-deoxy-manno-octulosonate cytidylyltransferase [Sedimentisphaerales bacterium]
MKVLAVIPARYSSTRFAGKVLAKDTGKYLIQHTYERACLAKWPEKVLIAVDDQKVVDAAKTFGAECVLTSPDHQSGTDRIAEAVADIDVEIVVNLQGDEPEIDPDNIDYLAKLLIDHPDYPMATLAAEFQTTEQIADPNIVKVIVSSCGMRDAYCDKKQADTNTHDARRTTHNEASQAIYFSRSPIPYDRDKSGVGDVKQYLRHIGIYAYRKSFLREITALSQTPLEKIEKLEQLRAIENGYGILVGKVEHTCDGIDTPEQYAEFVKRYKERIQT